MPVKCATRRSLNARPLRGRPPRSCGNCQGCSEVRFERPCLCRVAVEHLARRCDHRRRKLQTCRSVAVAIQLIAKHPMPSRGEAGFTFLTALQAVPLATPCRKSLPPIRAALWLSRESLDCSIESAYLAQAILMIAAISLIDGARITSGRHVRIMPRAVLRQKPLDAGNRRPSLNQMAWMCIREEFGRNTRP